MVPILTAERGVFGVGFFLLLMLAESVAPFRGGAEARWRRTLINLFITGSNALLLTVLLGGMLLAAYQACELHRTGLLHAMGVAPWWNVVGSVALLDGATYWWHRAYHQLPPMWRMHRVHHSDLDVDVTTSGRFHLTEMVLSACFRLGVIALWGASAAGVVIFEIVFGLFNQVEHANLRLPGRLDRGLRAVFVTPDMHRVHHSQIPEHTNSNYGTVFSCWDRLFGTYRVVEDQGALILGLPEYRTPVDVTMGKVLAMPFGPPCGAVESATQAAVS